MKTLNIYVYILHTHKYIYTHICNFSIDYWTQRGCLTWKASTIVYFAGVWGIVVFDRIYFASDCVMSPFWRLKFWDGCPTFVASIWSPSVSALSERIVLSDELEWCRRKWRWPIMSYSVCIGVRGLSETARSFRMGVFRTFRIEVVFCAEVRTMHLPNLSRIFCRGSNHAPSKFKSYFVARFEPCTFQIQVVFCD